MGEGIKFNLNNDIKVKLTEAGYQHWMTDWNKYYVLLNDKEMIQPLSYFKKKEDKDGYVTFQGWQFMEIFGKTIDAGRPPIFSTGIIIFPEK